MNIHRSLRLSWLFLRDDFTSTVLLGLIAVMDFYFEREFNSISLYSFSLAMILGTIYYSLYGLVHCISNQLYADDDILSKPHRPIPSKACTITEAHQLEQIVWYCYFLFGMWMKNLMPWVLIWSFIVYKLHDYFHIAWVKNIYNGIGFFTLLCAAATIVDTNPFIISTFCLPLLVVLTIWIQDFRDIEGDKQTGRITLPISLTEMKARWIMLLIILFISPWLIFLSIYSSAITFQLHLLISFILYMALILIGLFLLYSTNRKMDHRAYSLYVLWFNGLLIGKILLKCIFL